MRQQYFFHQFLLVGIAAATIAEIVLRAGAYTLLHVALLETLDKGGTHYSREITVFAIRLFQTIETGCATNIYHWRKRQYATHLS